MEGVIGGVIIPNTFRGLQDEVEVGEIGEERGTEEIIFPDVAGGPQGNGKVSDSVQDIIRFGYVLLWGFAVSMPQGQIAMEKTLFKVGGGGPSLG